MKECVISLEESGGKRRAGFDRDLLHQLLPSSSCFLVFFFPRRQRVFAPLNVQLLPCVGILCALSQRAMAVRNRKGPGTAFDSSLPFSRRRCDRLACSTSTSNSLTFRE